ncbi:hypothetical protein [Chitinophaga jiangningensis]|nr:hypothetical protein [Chitinophaga jiangningensis]
MLNLTQLVRSIEYQGFMYATSFPSVEPPGMAAPRVVAGAARLYQ